MLPFQTFYLNLKELLHSVFLSKNIIQWTELTCLHNIWNQLHLWCHFYSLQMHEFKQLAINAVRHPTCMFWNEKKYIRFPRWCFLIRVRSDPVRVPMTSHTVKFWLQQWHKGKLQASPAKGKRFMIICFLIVISTSGHETVNIFRSQTKKVKKKKTYEWTGLSSQKRPLSFRSCRII